MLTLLRMALLSAACVLVACANQQQFPGDVESMTKRYQRAEQLLPINLLKQVDNLYLRPQWLEDGGFWYSLSEHGHNQYWRYYPEIGLIPLFDEQKLVDALALDEQHALVSTLKIDSVIDNRLTLKVAQQHWSCELATRYLCQKINPPASQKETLISPDGNWRLDVRNYNLYLTNINSQQKTQLTFDGSKDYSYATESPSPKKYFSQPQGTVEPEKVVYWSDDSQYLVTFKLDLRHVGKLSLTQSVTGQSQRPRTYQYHYPMAGDEHLITGQIVLIDVANASAKLIDAPALLQTYYGDPLWGEFASNNKYYYVEQERGFHRFHLKELSPTTGQVRTLITETNDSFIDPWIQDFRVLPEQNMLLWTSERNGLQQLFHYRLDSAQFVGEMTPANILLRSIKSIDTDKQQLYFEGSGEQVGDPYFRYLYRVNFDGQDLTLLTSEREMHDTQISPDYQLFVDSISTVETAPRHVLKSTSDGRVLAELTRVDTARLFAAGYTPPQPFNLLANDGKTMLYGILYFPSDFDPQNSYAILDDIYTGPHGYFTPKSFASPLYAHASALAELGFIVLKMDGRGTAKRDRAFHEYSYRNLAGGADDHVWALHKLAETRPYIDLSRGGIYGFSAGGYDTVRAMYNYPDVFKVGVAASGNHDFRADKAGWNETWMDFPVAKHWDQQSNLTGAEKLQGKLLLAHGELDDNVHPAATLQLADKLIQANKDFELMIYPNMGHVLHIHPHFVRLRWDFFVKHLLNRTPPKAYQIESMQAPNPIHSSQE